MKLLTYFSPFGDAYRNLAMDEYFLTHLPSDTHMLYFYINDSAVIIGRNQNAFAECSTEVMKTENVQLVRRITGGGAVCHDGGNLNFSFLSPEGLYDTDEQDEILLTALRKLGIPAEKNGRNDLTAAGKKFSGNAFGAKRGNRLRHGTLLVSSDLAGMERYLTVSAKKLRAKGVRSVRSRVCNLCEFRPGLTTSAVSEAIRAVWEARYGMAAEEIVLSPAQESEISRLREERASFDWVMGEAPSFDFTVEDRFSFGMAQICISVEDGKISRATLYTDALDTGLSDRLPSLLTGIVFSPEAIRRALEQTGSPEFAELAAAAAENLK